MHRKRFEHRLSGARHYGLFMRFIVRKPWLSCHLLYSRKRIKLGRNHNMKQNNIHQLLLRVTYTLIGIGVGAGILVFSFALVHALSYVPIGRQLQKGSRGTDVSSLQTFLSSDKRTYPEGLVTGYFGPLTTLAVQRFQWGYGIAGVGRVGPLTLAKINDLINANTGIDVYAPVIVQPNVTIHSETQATVSWMTNELASGKVYFDTKPLVETEASRPQTEPSISAMMQSDAGLTVSKQIVLGSLAPHTTYYYVIEAKDTQGNVAVTEQNTFRTQ